MADCGQKYVFWQKLLRQNFLRNCTPKFDTPDVRIRFSEFLADIVRFIN